MQILKVPSLYILEITPSVSKNPDKYQNTVSIHSKETETKKQLHI